MNIMDKNPIKVMQLSGVINSSSGKKIDIQVNLKRDYADFHEGAWEICAKNVTTVATKLKKDHLYEVSSNFVYGQYTQTESRKPIPLERFTVKKCEEEQSDQVNLFSFDSTWYSVNSPSSEFKLYVRPCQDYTNDFSAEATLLLTFTLLFRRIK
jgi:hypothetical protein